jgi:ABC-type sulfate/molybdate transport systems ATPase subunit
LLLDEPFASLDRSLRDRLLDELPLWLAREGVAAIYVTHDANEACQIASHMLADAADGSSGKEQSLASTITLKVNL